jgi:hypothetical protein
MEAFMKNKFAIGLIIFFTCSFLFFLNCSNSPDQHNNNPADTEAPTAVLLNTPPSITNSNEINITVTGTDVVYYRYNLDNAGWSTDIAIADHIIEGGLFNGSHTIEVIGVDTLWNWQAEASATTCQWTVDTVGSVAEFLNISITLSPPGMTYADNP